ncbi:TPA: sigma factor-like helix-turn-helix DNA-binding protein [Pseudomonas aeruginosa]|uniref:sigma factor-like helix-turn-helix DNA-binding protein n=1 Tax=Pseudomonas aeruginosa TaxID=287 RepID=UPI0032E4E8E2
MKDNLDLKILEILEREPVSTRLHNAVLRAASEGGLPFESLSEYIQNKSDNIQRLFLIPNLGKKGVSELISMLDKYAKAIIAGNSHDSTSPKQILSVTIPAPYKSFSLSTFLRACQCSVQLHSALTRAIEKKEFGSETLGDLEGKSICTLRSELRKLPSLDQKSVDEFLDLLKTLGNGSVVELAFTEPEQQSQPLQYEASDLKTEFVSMLENESFASITVAEIINKAPGLSKQKGALLNKLGPVYRKSSLHQLLTSISDDIYEISEKIVTDAKLAPRLAALLSDFYRFLLSKKSQVFHHDEYFANDLSGLEDREAKVLLARLGREGQTLEELGQRFGVTRERIRQIESKALTKYVESNRIGLFHLSESLEKYVKASKGVLSVEVVQRLYGVSRQKLEVALNFVVPASRDAWMARDGDYIISRDFTARQDQLFGDIEAFIYRHPGGDSKTLIKELDGMNRPVLEYFIFRHQKKFYMSTEGDINIVINSASERARIVLAAAGQPLHTSEATRLYKTIFKEEVTEHALGSTLNRLPDVLIIGPGTFALYAHLKLDSDDIDHIRDEAYKFILSEGRYVNSRIIFEHISRIRPEFRQKEPNFNYYLVHGILQDDGRYRIGRGFMVGLPSYGDYLPLETEIAELVETHGPVSITEVMELLRPTRGELTNGSVRNSLLACDGVYLTAEKRQWDVADRVFNDPADIRRLQSAIRMAAYKESVALSSVYNRVRSTGIEYAVGTILSVVWKDPDITLERDYVRFDGTDTEIERYYATGEPTTLWQLDYRNHTEEKSVDTGVLDALMKEFDLYV